MTTELTDDITSKDVIRTEWGEQRSKVVTWHDPAPTTLTGLSMPGLDYMQAMIDGVRPPPPISGLMD